MRDGDITSVEVVRSKPWVIYAGLMADFSSGTLGRIARTTDWGRTWSTVADSISVSDIAVAPDDPGVVYAGLNANNGCMPGVLRTSDGGETWTRRDPPWLDSETWVSRLRTDPVQGNIVYAGIVGFFGGGLFSSTDRGVSWSLIPKVWEGTIPPLAAGVSALGIDPGRPERLTIGTSWDGYLYRSTDGGTTVSILRDTTDGLPAVIEVDKTKPGWIYLGTQGGGFRRSEDDGATWRADAVGLNSPAVNAIVQSANGTLYCGTGWVDAGGVYRSIDRGKTWVKIGIQSEYIQALALDEVGGFLYAAARNGPSPGLYRYKIP